MKMPEMFFFADYNIKIRKWLNKEGCNKKIIELLPLFKDGVVNPKEWFNNNEYRPLFILKEVNTGITSKSDDKVISDLVEYNNKWGLKTPDPICEFVTGRWDDIQNGKYATWKKIVRLSIALDNSPNKKDYRLVALNKIPGDLYENQAGINKEEIPDGYKSKGYQYTTSNADYIEAVNKIAVIDIKKIGAGGDVNSPISYFGKGYMDHFEYTRDELANQIKIISPSHIVCCCGPDDERIQNGIMPLLAKKNVTIKRWINANHPACIRNSSIKAEIEYCDKVLRDNDIS